MEEETVIKVEADELIIEPKNGKVIDLENSDLSVGKIVFKKKEKELPTKWEDLKKLDGFYVEIDSEIDSISDGDISAINRNVFPTKSEAEACLALSQLCQLRDAYNGEPLADWCDWSDADTKYCICFYEDKICKSKNRGEQNILSFKTDKLRDKFVKNFEDLILTAKPLL